MVWLPWKPHGDEEAGLKLGRLKPEQQAGPKRRVDSQTVYTEVDNGQQPK